MCCVAGAACAAASDEIAFEDSMQVPETRRTCGRATSQPYRAELPEQVSRLTRPTTRLQTQFLVSQGPGFIFK